MKKVQKEVSIDVSFVFVFVTKIYTFITNLMIVDVRAEAYVY